MHPPAFRPQHLLSDWPDCRIEVRCSACQHVAFIPVGMLRREHGDRTFEAIARALKCRCGARPAKVFLLAGQHREHCWGSSPDWAVELMAGR